MSIFYLVNSPTGSNGTAQFGGSAPSVATTGTGWTTSLVNGYNTTALMVFGTLEAITTSGQFAEFPGPQSLSGTFSTTSGSANVQTSVSQVDVLVPGDYVWFSTGPTFSPGYVPQVVSVSPSFFTISTQSNYTGPVTVGGTISSSDSFQTAELTQTFAAGQWTFALAIEQTSPTSVGGEIGFLIRVWQGGSPSSVIELTTSPIALTPQGIVPDAPINFTGTWNAPEVVMPGTSCLFFQIGCYTSPNFSTGVTFKIRQDPNNSYVLPPPSYELAITGLTGDGTASGPGVVPFTLATVSTAGTTGGPTSVPVITINAKGLVTAVSSATPTVSSVSGVSIPGSPSAGQALVATSSTTAVWEAFPAAGITGLTGDVTATGPGTAAATLAASGVSAGIYGGGNAVPVVNVDSKGRITSVSLAQVTPSASNLPTITLTGDAAGSGSGGTINTTVDSLQGTITLSGTPSAGYILTATSSSAASWEPNSGGLGITSLTGDGTATGPGASVFTLATVATAGTTGSSTQVPVITIDAKGRVTSVSTATPTVSAISGITVSGTPSIGQALIATSSTTADWQTPAVTGINQLTGDGTAGPGLGSQVLTLSTVNSDTGTFGDGGDIPVITVNGKGLITAVTTTQVTPSSANLPTITLTGDVSGSGSAGSIPTTLATVATAGTYGSGNAIPRVTIDAKGRVTSVATTPPTPTSANLPTITITGDVLGSGAGGTIGVSLATVATAGTTGGSTAIPVITIDVKGRTTSITTVTPTVSAVSGITVSGTPSTGQVLTATSSTAADWQTPSSTGITQLTGDVTAGPGSGSQASTLATSGVTAGTYGSTTTIPEVTFDAKGRATSASSVSLASGGLPTITLTGDTTGSGSGGSISTTTGRLQGSIVLSGTPAAGEALVATSSTAASWTSVMPVLRASSFGATGAVGVSQNTALQAMLDHAKSIGGARCYFDPSPSGTYFLTSPLFIDGTNSEIFSDYFTTFYDRSYDAGGNLYQGEFLGPLIAHCPSYPQPPYVNYLVGTFHVINGSASVTTTSSQVGILAAGNKIIFAEDATQTVYTLTTPINSTTITLTTNYTGTTYTATGALGQVNASTGINMVDWTIANGNNGAYLRLSETGVGFLGGLGPSTSPATGLTIECFVYLNSYTTGASYTPIVNGGGGVGPGGAFSAYTYGYPYRVVSFGMSDGYLAGDIATTSNLYSFPSGPAYPQFNGSLTSGIQIPLRTITHIAMSWGADGYLHWFVNGVEDTTLKTAITGTLVQNITEQLTMGCMFSGYIKPGTGYWGELVGENFDGYFGGLRISATQEYTTNFTPPTAELSTDAHTIYLLNFDPSNIQRDLFVTGTSTYLNDIRIGILQGNGVSQKTMSVWNRWNSSVNDSQGATWNHIHDLALQKYQTGMAYYSQLAPFNKYERLWLQGTIGGTWVNNCYECTYRQIFVFGGNAFLTGSHGYYTSESYGFCGVGASNQNAIEHIQFVYGGNMSYALILGGSGWMVTDPLIEGCANTLGDVLLLAEPDCAVQIFDLGATNEGGGLLDTVIRLLNISYNRTAQLSLYNGSGTVNDYGGQGVIVCGPWSLTNDSCLITAGYAIGGSSTPIYLASSFNTASVLPAVKITTTGFPGLSLQAQYSPDGGNTYSAIFPVPNTGIVVPSVGNTTILCPDGSTTPPPAAYFYVPGTSLSGTFAITNGSSTVPTTSSQVSTLIAGDAVTFSSDTSGTIYLVSSVTSAHIILQTNYTGTTYAASSGLNVTVSASVQNCFIRIVSSTTYVLGTGTFSPPDSSAVTFTPGTPIAVGGGISWMPVSGDGSYVAGTVYSLQYLNFNYNGLGPTYTASSTPLVSQPLLSFYPSQIANNGDVPFPNGSAYLIGNTQPPVWWNVPNQILFAPTAGGVFTQVNATFVDSNNTACVRIPCYDTYYKQLYSGSATTYWVDSTSFMYGTIAIAGPTITTVVLPFVTKGYQKTIINNTGNTITVGGSSSYGGALTGATVSIISGSASNIISTGQGWVTTTAPAITALTGDVTASGPGSAAATVNSISGSSPINITATETTLNSSGTPTAPISAIVTTYTTTNATTVYPYSIGTFPPATVSRFTINVLGVDTGGAGDMYSADYECVVQRAGSSSAVLNPTTPAPYNILTNGSGSSMSSSVSLLGNTFRVGVTGLSSTTIDWSIDVTQKVIS